MKKLSLVLFLVLGSLASWAQSLSQIQGVVQDGTGAAVPGAELKATQTETNVTRTVTSSADGTYVLANLPIGPYRLEVVKNGFTTYVQTGIVLQVNTNPTVNVSLKVGAVSEQVSVEANAALVETQATSVGSVIENRRILELPLNGRNPVELIQLAGAAVPGGKNGTAGMPGGLNISVAGSLLSGVTYFLDGTLHNNPFDAVNLPFPFPDALQEFKVETSTLTAQNGLHSGAAVSAVVKSGTNSYHGDLFEFLRNGELNARNYFAARRDSLKRNQFGGTVGGAIKKDKLFFFAGYQGTKTRSDPAGQTAFVPTSAMLAGDFSQCPTFATLIDPNTGAAATNKFIDPSRFSTQALNVVKFLPKPNAGDPCGRVPFGAVQKINEYQTLGRIDYQVSDRQMLFGRYMATAYLLPSAYAFSGNILDSTTGGLDNLAQSIAAGHTFLISPTTVNTLRVAANRVAVHRFNDDYFSGCDIGVQMSCYVPHQTVFNVNGAFNIGIATAIEATFIPSYYTLSDDVSMVRGSHQFAFGFSGFKYQHSQVANIGASANMTMGALNAGLNQGTGVPLADFLLGRVSSFSQGSPNTVFTTKWYYGLYAQDTWKATRRLTVNAGIRWEPFLPQRLNNGAVYNFDWNRFNSLTRSTVFKNAPAGLLYGGDPGFEGMQGVQKRYNQFAPRLGLAFDPKGDGKTSIRASFGMSYDFPNVQIMSNPASAPPFGNTVALNGPLALATPWAAQPGGNPFPSSFGPNVTFVNNGQYLAQQPDAKATTVYSWNLGVQRQLGKDWLVSATYLGTHTVHLWVSYQLNPAVLVAGPVGTGTCAATATNCNGTANINARRVANLRNPAEGKYFSFLDQFETGGTMSYNGLMLSMQKRLSRGISVNGNYTWSHCIGDITQASSVGGFGTGLLDPNNRKFDRGNCQTPTLDGTQSLDRRHVANFTAVLEAPKFSGKMLRLAASDWRLSTSYRVLSGAYQTVTTGVDRQLSGATTATQRPDQVLADTRSTTDGCVGVTGSCVAWLNKAAFAQPAFGTLGNLGRSNVPGPGFFQIDMALSRIFRVHEGMTFELRGEAFNITNSLRRNAPNVNLNSPQFGQILMTFPL
jgi:hypothetical protein